MYFFNFGDFHVVGSSPEVLVRVEDNLITVRPIAGTRPRGATISMSGNQTAYWTSPTTQQAYYFDYRRGEISFVYSDEAIVKAKSIAQALAARIRGDEGEEY